MSHANSTRRTRTSVPCLRDTSQSGAPKRDQNQELDQTYFLWLVGPAGPAGTAAEAVPTSAAPVGKGSVAARAFDGCTTVPDLPASGRCTTRPDSGSEPDAESIAAMTFDVRNAYVQQTGDNEKKLLAFG